MMNNSKTLSEMVKDIQMSKMTRNQKAQALVKIGVTPYEAMILARARMTAPAPAFTFEYTFGVEIETVNCAASAFMQAATSQGLNVINHLSCYSGCHIDIPQFKIVPDGSLSGTNTAECVTPALNGNENGFDSLKKLCDALSQIGATVNKSCGLHVHIGAADLTNEEYCNVFVNYMRLELAIESFLAPSRRGMRATWCYSLRNRKQRVLLAATKQQMAEALGHDRYHRVNAESYSRHRTIEFRQHQGTVSYTKIEAWVKFLAKLVEYSKTNRLNNDIDRIEDIPFLSEEEKNYFISRRTQLNGEQAA